VFDDRDTPERERVVIVNETLARQLWPGSDAVGKRIYWGGTTGRTRTVVGVTRDFQDERLGASPGPMLVVPHAQVDLAGMTIVARTSIDAGAAAAALREAIRRIDPSLPAPAVRSVNDSRAAAAAQPRFNAALLSTFAIIAFVLAVTGVYAMLAFAAEERKRELAIRVALGASGRIIVQHLLMRGLMLTGLGILAGLVLAVGASRALASILYGVRPTDPWSFGVAVSTLIAAAALACYLPARHAARVDPLVLLRD
jgi:predicted lysophospholipase L1 biosynthesis ABC-type transport system permease subunit